MALVRLLVLCVCSSAISVNYVPNSVTPPPQRELPGLAFDSKENKLYIYGGRSEVIHEDMWEFDRTHNSWNEIHPASVINPGPRSAGYLTILEGSRQMVLFGGDAKNGPVSDVWLYDIDNQMVKVMQWQLQFTKGKAPPRAYYRAVCSYNHEGKHYIAVYGGKNHQNTFIKSLHILDLETYTWTSSESELGPSTSGGKMDYYKGKLYVYSEKRVYIYNLDTSLWIYHLVSDAKALIDYSQCIYDNKLYLILGWDIKSKQASRTIYKIDLSSELYISEVSNLSSSDKDIKDVADKLIGCSCRDHVVYLFGGSKEAGYSNTLSELDLSNKHFTTLSKPLDFPTARKGHAMEAYDDKLYIFGGVDGNENQ